MKVKEMYRKLTEKEFEVETIYDEVKWKELNCYNCF